MARAVRSRGPIIALRRGLHANGFYVLMKFLTSSMRLPNR